MIGFDLPGCFSEYAILPENSLVLVDDAISDSEGACLQSLSDSVASVETAGIQIGDSVAIIGQGSMGLECLQVARLSGAGLLITTDVRDESCEISKQLGADYALNGQNCDIVETILERTNGVGVDVVFECAGGSPKQGLAGSQTVQQAMRGVRSGGKIIGVSWLEHRWRSNSIFCTSAAFNCFPISVPKDIFGHTVRLVASGRVKLGETIRHRLNGIESVPEAFEITANKSKYQAINPAQVIMKSR